MSIGEDFIRWVVDVLLVGGVLFVIIDRIKYRRENKSLKRNEVTGSDLDNETKRLDNEAKKLENDQKQIDIGSLFLERVQAAAEVVENASKRMTDSSNKLQVIEENQTRMLGRFDGVAEEIAELRRDIAEVKREQSLERDFLNGQFDAYRRQRLASEQAQGDTARQTAKPAARAKRNPVPRKKGWKPSNES